jgi:hypothetical protein
LTVFLINAFLFYDFEFDDGTVCKIVGVEASVARNVRINISLLPEIVCDPINERFCDARNRKH